MDKQRQCLKHISGLIQAYPVWDTDRFIACPTNGCDGKARGFEMCPACHERGLSEMIGEDLAKEFHNHCKRSVDLIGDIMQAATGDKDDS